MQSKKALSPLVATILLVAFALVIGTATMSWGKNYVKNIPDEPADIKAAVNVCFDRGLIDDELKEAQLDYIIGELTLDEYLSKQDTIVRKMNPG
jgi:flagellin-like protein